MLVGLGKAVPQIGHQLNLAMEAVRDHCARIRKKLKLRSSTDLVRYAVCWVETGAA